MHRTIMTRLTGMALLAIALMLVVAPPAAAQATAIAFATGTPGVVAVEAGGFEADEALAIWLTGPSQQVQASNNQSADGDGDTSFEVSIPRHFEPGRWAITIHGLESEEEAIATFVVLARDADATLTASPASGPAGTTFTFSGSGFGSDEVVSYWLTGPDGKSYEGGDATSGGDGTVSFTYAVGSGSQGGAWRMSAYGQASDRLALATFTVG